jgi:hypothetical protein
MGIRHAKISSIQTTGDPSLVGPGDWNSDHTIVGTLDLSGASTIITGPGGINGVSPVPFTGAPSGPCTQLQTAIDTTTGNYYDCFSSAWHAVGSNPLVSFAGAPTGSCTQLQTAIDTTTGNYYDCFGGTWQRVGPGAATLTNPVISPNPLNLDINTTFKGPNPYIDATRFGVRAVAGDGFSTTVSCTSGSANVSIGSASSFINGDGVALYNCGPGTVAAPAAPTVTPSVAAAQTGTLIVVNAPTGSTTYCYQLVARTFRGATNVGAETCTTTGPASLGQQTNTISTITLANNVATYTTTAAHGLVVGAHIVVQGTSVALIGGDAFDILSRIPFDGWFTVATVPDNTHFTVLLFSDSRNGAITAGTGGTVNYWNSIHIKATETTNNYQYYVYGRVSGGTKTLIGTMWPQNSGFLGNDDYLAFDDFGSPVTTFPNPPTYIPTTVPTSGTNDMLSTTIVSGAGTTSLVLANSAGNTASGTILFDNAVTFLAAATYAANAAGGTQGALVLPEIGATANSLNYVFNSPLSLGVGPTSRLVVYQKGLVRLHEPIQTTFISWIGQSDTGAVAASFANFMAPQIQFGRCSPCFIAESNTYFYNLVWSMLSANGALAFLQENGGIPSAGAFRDIVIGTSNGSSNDYSNMGMLFRGGAGFEFSNIVLGGTQHGSLVANTPGMYFEGGGNCAFRNLSLSGVGTTTRVGFAGGFITVEGNLYCQGCFEPYFATARGISDAQAGFWMKFGPVTFDTTSVPLVANYGGHGVVVDLTNINGVPNNDPIMTGSGRPSSPFPVSTFNMSGAGAPSVNIGANANNNTFSVNDGTFGRVALPLDIINRSVTIGLGFSLFSNTAPPAPPTSCTVSSGGSVPTGQTFYFYEPIFANGSGGTISTYCIATPTTGNQTVTVNWTAIPGATKYNVYRGQTLNATGLVTCSGAVSTTSYVDTLSTGCGGSPLQASGGPAGMHGSTGWDQTHVLGLTSVTSAATAARTLVLPDSNAAVIGTSTFANLGTPANGTFNYCSDCTLANPCAGSGTGALAKRLNSIWVCN